MPELEGIKAQLIAEISDYIDDFEKAQKKDQRSVLEKRKENIQEILKVLRKQKAQGKKKAGKGLTGYDMLTGKVKKDK